MVDELIFVDSTGEHPAVESIMAENMHIPVSSWAMDGINPSHYICLGLAEMATQPKKRDFLNLTYESATTTNTKQTVRDFSPIKPLRLAMHIVMVILLLLTVNLFLGHQAQAIRKQTLNLTDELVRLKPAIAESVSLYSRNQALMEQINNCQDSQRYVLFDFTDQLIKLTPNGIQLQELAVGQDAQTALAIPQPRRILPENEAQLETYNVSISGIAPDALAFADYLSQIEQSKLLQNVSFREAEVYDSVGFSFIIEGEL